jgi:hypothetical protein
MSRDAGSHASMGRLETSLSIDTTSHVVQARGNGSCQSSTNEGSVVDTNRMSDKEKLAAYAQLYGAGDIKVALIVGRYPDYVKKLEQTRR